MNLDLSELDKEIGNQNTKIDRLREKDAEINKYIAALEGGLSLSEEQQVELIEGVSRVLEKSN